MSACELEGSIRGFNDSDKVALRLSSTRSTTVMFGWHSDVVALERQLLMFGVRLRSGGCRLFPEEVALGGNLDLLVCSCLRIGVEFFLYI